MITGGLAIVQVDKAERGGALWLNNKTIGSRDISSEHATAIGDAHVVSNHRLRMAIAMGITTGTSSKGITAMCN
jgi:hypothetical protein